MLRKFNIFMHAKVPVNLFDGKKVLDLGCGRKKLPGAVGLDQHAFPGVDVVSDLNKSLPFEDGAFDAVFADQVLEHVTDVAGLVAEIHRVLRPGGVFLAHCPYFRSCWAWIDPTHVRAYTIKSMDYFVQGTFCHGNYRFNERAFETIEVFLDTDYPSTFLRRIFTSLALRRPWEFENSFLSSMYPFAVVSYVLTKPASEGFQGGNALC